MREVAELNGDGIAGELRDAIHALNGALGGLISFRPVDWSVERRETSDAAVEEGIELTRSLGAAMKYPTETKSFSPNQILRDRLDLAVIHRPCRTYPGVSTNYTGANAEVIESQITEPLEKAINGIAGIRTISSSSAATRSTRTP